LIGRGLNLPPDPGSLDEESEATKMKKMILIVMAVLLIAVSVSRADYEPYRWDQWTLTKDQFVQFRDFLKEKPYGGIQLTSSRWATSMVVFKIPSVARFELVYVLELGEIDDQTFYLGVGVYDGVFIKNGKRYDISKAFKSLDLLNVVMVRRIKSDFEKVDSVVEKKKVKREWLQARLRPGVKVYYGSGSKKTYMGKVLNFKEVDGVRYVLFEMASGRLEWKLRNAVLSWGWVLSDDPALQ
jgi:hypothetical protein